MTAFVDTSAFLALLDADEARHAEAVSAWARLADQATALVTTNYVVVETMAVAQHRLGLDAVRDFVRHVLPVVDLIYVDVATHGAGVTALLAANRRQLSLVDCVSFEAMRQRGLRRAFAFDSHFDEMGFALDMEQPDE